MVEVKHRHDGVHDVAFPMDGEMQRIRLYGDEYIKVSDEVYERIKGYVRVKPGPSPVDEDSSADEPEEKNLDSEDE